MMTPPVKERSLVLCLAAGVLAAFSALAMAQSGGLMLWVQTAVAWLFLWLTNHQWSAWQPKMGRLGRAADIGIPLLFGFTLLFLWEVLCVGLKVPTVLLPPPSLIGAKLVTESAHADHRQSLLLEPIAEFQ